MNPFEVPDQEHVVLAWDFLLSGCFVLRVFVFTFKVFSSRMTRGNKSLQIPDLSGSAMIMSYSHSYSDLPSITR